MSVVLITGASRGIGRAVAKHFASLDYRVVVHYHTEKEAAEALVSEICAIGADALAVYADVSKEADVDALFSQAEKAFGGVDVLVNNAGISRVAPLADVSSADWDEMLAVNAKSAFLCSKRAQGAMIRRAFGRIINIASMWGLVGASCEVPYSASKAALIGFTKALAKELAPSGVTVNAVAPGFIDTAMNAHLSAEERAAFLEEIPISRAGTPEEIAYAVAFLADKRAGYITGQVIAVDGGLT